MPRIQSILNFEDSTIRRLQENAVRNQPRLTAIQHRLYTTTWTLSYSEQHFLNRCYIRYSNPARFAAIISHDTREYKQIGDDRKQLVHQFNTYPVYWSFDISRYEQSVLDMVLVSFRAHYALGFYAALVRIVQISERELSSKFGELN